MTHATSLYRLILLEIERARIALGWASWQIDDYSGIADGHYQKLLHCDAPSGRQGDWRTIQQLLDTVMPEGFDVVIKRKKGVVLDAPRASHKIRFIRATYHRKTQRELGVEFGRIGGLKSAEMLDLSKGKQKRRRIAKAAANARWIKARAKVITANLDNATGQGKIRPPRRNENGAGSRKPAPIGT